MWMQSALYKTLLKDGDLLGPLSPNLRIQILQIDLHLFPLRINWENSINFPCDDHLLMSSHTLSFYDLSQEKRSWSTVVETEAEERGGGRGKERKENFSPFAPLTSLFAPITPLFASLFFISPRNALYLGSPLQQSWGITCSLPFV